MLTELPSPPKGRTSWPWTEATPALPVTMPNGEAWPRISIVTPSFNQGQFIEETIRSVLLQGYPNLEYIIIDGGSTDESVEIIKKYEPWLTYWVSEKDQGQAHAINKGVKRCTGEFFNWINSDDLLTKGALRLIAEAFENYEAVAGMCTHFRNHEHILVNACKNLSAANLMGDEKDTLFQQPPFWMRTQAFRECDAVNPKFHYAFDWDMAVRYLYDFPRVKYLDEELALFRLHDASKTESQADKFVDETMLIARHLRKRKKNKRIRWLCQKREVKMQTQSLIHDREISVSRLCLIALEYPYALTTRFYWGVFRRSIGLHRR